MYQFRQFVTASTQLLLHSAGTQECQTQHPTQEHQDGLSPLKGSPHQAPLSLHDENRDQDLPAGWSPLSQVKDDDGLVRAAGDHSSGLAWPEPRSQSYIEHLDCLQENPIQEVQASQEPGPAEIQHEESMEASRQGQGAALQSQ